MVRRSDPSNGCKYMYTGQLVKLNRAVVFRNHNHKLQLQLIFINKMNNKEIWCIVTTGYNSPIYISILLTSLFALRLSVGFL